MIRYVLKFISSIILTILVIMLITFSLAFTIPFVFIGLLVMFCFITCIIKFLIVMVTEPDSLWEIIKKFLYLFLAVFVLFTLFATSKVLLIIIGIVAICDMFLETKRFYKGLKN